MRRTVWALIALAITLTAPHSASPADRPAKADNPDEILLFNGKDFTGWHNFKAEGVNFHSIVTASGITARAVGEKYEFKFCVSTAEEIISDDEANLVVIATRHGTHAELARRALERGKHVFVEKPLAINDEELDRLLQVASESEGRLAQQDGQGPRP